MIFRFVLFAALFNIALIFIASTGWFGTNTLYGDTFVDVDEQTTAEALFNIMVLKPAGTTPSLFGVELTFTGLMVGLIGASVVVGFLTKSGLAIISVGLVGYLFIALYANSTEAFYKITNNLGSSVTYLVLMVGLGVLIMFVITLMDYASGQHSG